MSDELKGARRRRNEEAGGTGPAAERAGRALAQLDRMCSAYWPGEVLISTVKLRLGETDNTETLVVVCGELSDGTPVVGFSTALVPSEALVGAINRVVNGNMNWRQDDYRNGRAVGRDGTSGQGEGKDEG